MITAWLLAASAACARAEQVGRVLRSDLPVSVAVQGNVVASVSRIKSDFDGRLEQVRRSTAVWSLADQPIGYLASAEMAAMLDSHSTTIQDVVEKRWQNVYRLQPIACAEDCYVMRVYVKEKQQVQAHTLMFETAELRLVGHVRAEDAHWIRDGQIVEYWVAGNPKKRYRARVQRYNLDLPAKRRVENVGVDGVGHEVSDAPGTGGTFATTLTPSSYLPPGTKWEGRVIPATRKRAYLAPTESLIEYKGALFLPVRVSTGVTTPDVTEIVDGIDREQEVLVIDEARFKEATRYRQTADEGALQKRFYQQQGEPKAVETSPEPATSVRRETPSFVPPKERTEDTLPDPDAVYSETPYDR